MKIGEVGLRIVCLDERRGGPDQETATTTNITGRGRDGGHEESMVIGSDGRVRGAQPRAKVSMMIMRPPQRGHGGASVGGALASEASARHLNCRTAPALPADRTKASWWEVAYFAGYRYTPPASRGRMLVPGAATARTRSPILAIFSNSSVMDCGLKAAVIGPAASLEPLTKFWNEPRD